MLRSLTILAMVFGLLAGCAGAKEDAQSASKNHSVSKLCSGSAQVQLSSVANYLQHSLKDKNDPQLEKLFKEYALGKDGNINEELKLKDCQVAADGSLIFNASDGKGASKTFNFATKGSSVIALSPDVSRPAPDSTATCQQDKVTFFRLVLSPGFAAYEETSADTDYILDFAQTVDAEVFSDAECKTPEKSIKFPKDSQSIPISVKVAEDEKASLTFAVVGLSYGDSKTIWGPVTLTKPTEHEADATKQAVRSAPDDTSSTPATPQVSTESPLPPQMSTESPLPPQVDSSGPVAPLTPEALPKSAPN